MTDTALSKGLALQQAKHDQPAFTTVPTTTPTRATLSRVLSDVMVPMRDGVRLATDAYLPEGPGPFPAILTRMPYGKTEPYCAMPAIARHWVAKGYAAVVQDVRGKWGSEGRFEANKIGNEIPDGTDTIAWIAAQLWSDGRVGMWGESYFGFTSWAGAVGGHPALTCIAPGDITLDRFRGTYRYGALQLNTVGMWAIGMAARTYQGMAHVDTWHLPLAEMANAGGVPSPYFDDVVANPTPGPFWTERSLLQALDLVRIPVLHWSGWYDNYLGRVIADWRDLRARNAPTRHNHLFIGPWDHEGTADALHRVGLLPVDAGTGAHKWDTFQAFFDRYLMGLDNGFDRRGAAHVYTMGADRWIDLENWPPPDAVATDIFLHSGGRANGLDGDGTLDRVRPGDEPPDRFVYDPADPVADTVEIDCWSLAGQMGDRRPIERRADVLVYTSAPLEADLEVTGPITATLHIQSSAPDTDFTVALVDVFENQTAHLVQDGILRARYRESLEAPSLLEPGRPYTLTVDLWATSHVFRKGHWLRVEVSSSCFNRYDRNPNTADLFGRAPAGVKATQTIHHAADRASRITLPVRPG